LHHFNTNQECDGQTDGRKGRTDASTMVKMREALHAVVRKKRIIPITGLLSCWCSLKSQLSVSSSIFTSKIPPIYLQHENKFADILQYTQANN